MGKPYKRKGGKDEVAEMCATRIRACREERDWTQSDLAKATGWDPDKDGPQPGTFAPSRIGNYEQGTRRLGLEEAKIIGKAFGLPAAYFMGAVDEKEARVLQAMEDPDSRQLIAPAVTFPIGLPQPRSANHLQHILVLVVVMIWAGER